jgi:ribonucleoside-diphosphate reductase alpha chain
VTVSINDVTEQRKTVFLDRYSKKDASGKPTEKDFNEMWGRVAIALSDESTDDDGQTTLSAPHYSDFYRILEDFKFVPGGRILAGAGVGSEQTFYNCYVIPVEPKPSTKAVLPNVGNDSREAIFDTISTMVDIMSRGGGVGINWSVLRPAGSYLTRVNGSSSGPVGWMDVASKAVGEVEQGGSRRGAAMFMIDDWHPDVLDFINAKRNLGKITNANVSVAISDEFMKAVKNDARWLLEYPTTSDPHYNSEWDGDMAGWRAKGYAVTTVRSVPAREIWNAIIEAAWDNGEPGVVFLGRYNKVSTGLGLERIISVNPCGEQGLGAYSVCNLGSMNLAAYVASPEDKNGPYFDFSTFRYDVATAVRFLDNVIDRSFYWDERSRAQQAKLRRIGLGVMGLADALIALGLRYGSPEAVKFTEDVFRTMKDTAIETSIKLAEEKGPAEGYTDDVWKRRYLAEYRARVYQGFPSVIPGPLRNLFFLTQAPTGTTSILAGVNSGIEPYFAAEYTRKDRTGTHVVKSPPWQKFEDAHGPGKWTNMPPEYVTANDVSVEEHIAMQAAVQKYVDSSVSKTINAPNSHKKSDVDKAYMLAYDSGLKGVAYFRDGCGRDQVLTTGLSDKTAGEIQDTVSKMEDELNTANDRIAQLEEQLLFGSDDREWRRPDTVFGYTKRVNTSMGTMYLTVNCEEDGTPVEVFVNVGKAGSDVMALGEALGRLISMNLQNGVSVAKVAAQLTGVGGTSSFNPGLVHALGKVLDADQAMSIPQDDKAKSSSGVYLQADPPPVEQSPANRTKSLGSSCPECKEFSLIRTEGCLKCLSCDYTAC